MVAKVGGSHFLALLAPETMEHVLPPTSSGLPHLMVDKHDFQLPQFIVLCHFWSPGFVVITINAHVSSFFSGDPSKNPGVSSCFVSRDIVPWRPWTTIGRLDDHSPTPVTAHAGVSARAKGTCARGISRWELGSKVRISGF